MIIIRVGDPHITIRNLSDGEKLVDFIIKIAKENDADSVEFMGDLFHTHAVVRIEVIDFWKRAFIKIGKEAGVPILTLVGNHDQPGSKEKEYLSALDVFSEMDHVKVVNKPFQIEKTIYVPYMGNKNDFLDVVNKAYKNGATKMLVAHQTFTGATYENGFYDKDGIEPGLVPQERIISGHIHRQQVIDKCHYIGTPKWDTMADANEDKGIWIFKHAKDGSVTKSEFVSTKDIVTPIYKYVVKEGEIVPELNKNAKNFIEFQGSTAWIGKMKKKYKGHAQIKAKPTDKRMDRLDLDKNVGLLEYLEKYFKITDGVEKKEIKKYLKEVA